MAKITLIFSLLLVILECTNPSLIKNDNPDRIPTEHEIKTEEKMKLHNPPGYGMHKFWDWWKIAHSGAFKNLATSTTNSPLETLSYKKNSPVKGLDVSGLKQKLEASESMRHEISRPHSWNKFSDYTTTEEKIYVRDCVCSKSTNSGRTHLM